MYIRDYLRAYLEDWVSLMSGGASVAFTFWAILTDPNNVNLRKGLWIVSALCFIVASYRVWSREHKEVHRLQAETEKEINQIVREFNEIKANILLSTLEPVIAAELKRLKAFLHKYPGLLGSNLGKFYETFIAPREIHLHYGASLDFKQAEYKQMKEQLAQIDLRSGTESKEQ
jgi:hypothetical protein